jgi:hypothetical protein
MHRTRTPLDATLICAYTDLGRRWAMTSSDLAKWFSDHLTLASTAVIGVSASLGSYFFGRWQTRRDLRESTDRKTVESLVRRLPRFEDIRRFFKDQALTDPFEMTTMDAFLSIVDETMNDPLATFNSRRLRKSLANVRDRGATLRKLVATETFLVPGTRGGPREHTIRRTKYGDSIDDMEVGERLNVLATDVFVAYEDFLRHAKRVVVSIDRVQS